MSNYNHILYQVNEGILTLTINRPHTYNALSTDTKLELADAFRKANEDPKTKAIVLTGAGDKSFCSGQDLSESQSVNEETAKAWIDEFDHLYRTIRNVDKPIIGSINGFSTGSGLQLALLCDIRISNETAKYGMTEIDVGLACIIGTAMFWEVMGKSRTIDLILTGRLLTAVEAERYGLVTRVVPNDQLIQETQKLAKELAAKPPVDTRINKKWFNQLSDQNFNKCMHQAVLAHQEGYASGEPQRRMVEFFQKRKANKG
jgi:enoyl-CoA hydratase